MFRGSPSGCRGLVCSVYCASAGIYLLGEKIDSIALFGTYCICLTNVHRSNRYEAFNITNKQLICVAKSNDHKQKAFQTDYREIRYDCAKR